MNIFYEDFSYLYHIERVENLDFAPHLHKHIELIYVLQGHTIINISNSTVVVKPGDLAIAFPNEIHSYRNPSDNKNFMLLFTVECSPGYKEIFSRFRPKNSILSAASVHPMVAQCLETLFEEQDRMDIKLVKAYINVILGNVIKNFDLEEVLTIDDLSLPQQALIYLYDNFKSNLTLETVASHLFISKNHLSRVFSQKIGINFNTYLNTLRMEEAEKLLTGTNKLITEISYECGYESQRSFNRVFKKHFNMTPRQFRTLNS